jgi:rare lipoprotein A (peptidoglycan hydrolase)
MHLSSTLFLALFTLASALPNARLRQFSHTLSRRDGVSPIFTVPRSHRLRAKKRQDATIQCDSDSTWSLCDGTNCTSMGPVADGTVCVGNAIVVAPAAGGSGSNASPAAAASPTPTSADSSSTEVVVCATDSSSSTQSSSTFTSSAAPTTTTQARHVQAQVQVNVPTPTSTNQAPSPTPTSSSGSGSGTEYYGKATWYTQDGGTGACGLTLPDSALIVAMQTQMYGDGSYCGRQVLITNLANNQQVSATIRDECPGCSTSTSLDLSVAAFDAIGNPDTGVLDIKWEFTS